MTIRAAQPDLLANAVNQEETPEGDQQIEEILTNLGVKSEDLADEVAKIKEQKGSITPETAKEKLDDLETKLINDAIDSGDTVQINTILTNQGTAVPG